MSRFSGYHAEGYHAPPISYGYHAQGYHARTDTFKPTRYHVCRVTTPELPRSIQTSGYRLVITPAGSFWLFFLSSANTSELHNNNHNFSTESGAHRTDPHNILYVLFVFPFPFPIAFTGLCLVLLSISHGFSLLLVLPYNPYDSVPGYLLRHTKVLMDASEKCNFIPCRPVSPPGREHHICPISSRHEILSTLP